MNHLFHEYEWLREALEPHFYHVKMGFENCMPAESEYVMREDRFLIMVVWIDDGLMQRRIGCLLETLSDDGVITLSVNKNIEQGLIKREDVIKSLMSAPVKYNKYRDLRSPEYG